MQPNSSMSHDYTPTPKVREIGRQMAAELRASAASIAAAKADRAEQQALAVAAILARLQDLTFNECSPAIQSHFLKWAWVALRGADLSTEQFTTQTIALHAAAQAVHNRERFLDHDMNVDLLHHDIDRAYFTKVAQAGVEAYLRHLGNESTARNEREYGKRLKVIE